MPITVDPPTIVLNALRKLIARGFEQMLEVFWDDLFQLFSDLWGAFPNLFSMLDLLVQFATGLLGRLVTVPFAGIEGYLLDILRYYKLQHRVMTTEQFVKAVVRAQSEVVTNLTGTSSNGVVTAMLQGMATWAWSLFKRFQFLQKLTRITSYEQLAKLFVGKFTSRARFYGFILFVVAVFASIAWTGAIAILLGTALAMVTGEFQKYLLPQDSKRVWRSRGAVHRQNKRRGPDAT